MNIDVTIQDLKGITEYTKEERENEELKKQIKVAEGSLEMMVKKLCRKYPLLQPAFRVFEFTAVKENIFLETDGIHVFYQPQRIQDLYVNKKLKILEEKYIHLVLHGLLGHYCYRSFLGKDSLWDAIMDYEVQRITQSMTAKKADETDKEQLGTRGLYWYAKNKKRLESQLKHYKVWDNHEVWERETEKKTGSIQLEKSEDGEKRDSWETIEGDAEGNAEGDVGKKWKDIQELIGNGNEVDKKTLEKMLKEKMYGKDKGDSGESYEAAEENGNSYRERIMQFIREREIIKEQDGTIDKMLYSFGFELYGNVAFIEPEEFSENKALKKVVIAIDTSGSCSGEVMNEFLRETRNLLQDISEISTFEEVILMQCDAKIQKEEHFEDAEEFPEENSWKMKGFGGTAFEPVFERVKELSNGEPDEIDFLVYFSDGDGSFPQEKPEYPVFFVLSEECRDIPDWVIPIYLQKNNQ